MLHNQAVDRLTGIMLIASVLVMFAHVAADVALGHGRASAFFVLLYGFPVGLAGAAVYSTFRRQDPAIAMLSGFCLSGHGLLAVLTGVLLMVGVQFPAEFALFGAEPGSPTGMASSLEMTMDKVGKSAYAFLGLGLGLVGLLILATRALPRWIGWFGLAAGTAGFLACLAGLGDLFTRSTMEAVVGIAILSNLVFMAILGVRLVSSQVREARAPSGDHDRALLQVR